ncbi:MAG: PEP-CTERM sorting domain-containing protein [Chthoniobacteraceae bacterium]
MKFILRALTMGALTFGLHAELYAAESFVSAVLSYTPGTDPGATVGNFYSSPASVLGKPSAQNGTAPFVSAFTPFNPNYAASDIVSIGAGGELTLQLANYVLVDDAPGALELGVWESVFLNGAPPNYDLPTNPATATGAGSAVVQVSADNVTWFSLNGGNRITFTLPGNYYANSTGAYDPAPASPVNAEFGKPFTGTLASFDGTTSYAQVLAVLGGSAGGTWLDVPASSGLTQIGYVRFSGVAADEKLDLDAVAINGARIGASTPPIPEPGSTALLAAAGLTLGARRLRRG